MRAGVWCAAALALLAAVAGSALRPTQAESGIKPGRRLSQRSDRNGFVSSSRPEDGEATSIRPRSSRRREQQFEREVSRTRNRSRTPEPGATVPLVDNTEAKSQTESNERFSSRRTYNRTRNRPSNQGETKTETTSRLTVNSYPARSRTRQLSRRGQMSTPSAPPKIDENKLEVINTNIDDISKMNFNETTAPTTQFRRRSSTTVVPTETEALKQARSRFNSRVENLNTAADLASSGTTNSISVSEKEPTTSRIIGDIRSSRKLRYKTRLSETDTNLTGQGLTVSTDPKSSQNIENVASQPEFQTSKPVVVSDSTEAIKETTTIKRKKVVRRPLKRGNATNKPVFSQPLKLKSDDEINEDDNYPESFKALLQAKNASTHSDSQSSESLSVKASEKIYNTYTPSPLTVITETDNAQNKSRFRNKPTSEDKPEKAETVITQKPKEYVKPEDKAVERKFYKRPENKPRPTFAPRNRKLNSIKATTASSTTSSYSEKPVYKFNRKFKITTTESPGTENFKTKRLQSSNLLKKPLVRPSYYSRSRNSNKSDITSTEKNLEIVANDKDDLGSSTIKTTTKEFLPRTSYYAKSRTNKKEVTDSPMGTNSEEKKGEPAFEKPNIYTSDTSSVNDNSVDSQTQKSKEPEEIFVIAVTSKESMEKNTENNALNSEKENENIQVTRYYIPTTAKYHSSYKDFNTVLEESEEKEIMVTSTPPIRNIKSRNYARSRKPEKEHNELSVDNIAPTTEVHLKSISDSYYKTASAPSNGITSEPEKSKGRFSSKYRASYLDTKPFYKATVPTVTPSTVEGEEIQLGPDLNAISFTQTRRTLSSADLRLSESVAKPSHTMNVEASNHSPSVTVSIYDALAEILTSTPRPQLSSTTEVPPKSNINTDVKQILNGVSSNINVNSVSGLSSQDTIMSINSDVTTDTKLVKITDQTTPTTVINRMAVAESVTSSLNEEISMNVPSSSPIPPPTTPLSARRPFAIKVLYTATEIPTDMTSSTNKPSTDNPTTVHNTVSIVSNSNLVSSELTSMLSNNIRDILENMDEKTRSKVSVDMANLLKNLIPRAVSGMSNSVEIIPETTPYSLEDIKDTEIITDLDNSNLSNNKTELLQTVNAVNSVNNSDSEVEENEKTVIKQRINTPVNNFDISDLFSDPELESTSQTTLTNIPVTTPFVTIFSTNVVPKTDVTLTDSVDNDTAIVYSENNNKSNNSLGPNIDATNSDQVLPIPFFTNSKISDFTTSELKSLNNSETTLQAQSVPISTTTTRNPNSLSSQPKTDFTLTDSVDNDTVVVYSENNNKSGKSLVPNIDDTNSDQVLPIPFFTNSKISDFTLGELGSLNNFETSTQAQFVPISTTTTRNPDSLSPQPDLENIDTLDPSKVSPLQLWVLSKKASVLKMIENLIRQHKQELELAPSLTETINKPMSVSVSERLSEIMSNMNTTTTIDLSNLSDMIATVMTTTSTLSPDPTNPSSTYPSSSESETSTSLMLDDAPTSRMSSADISVTLDEAVRSLLETTTAQITSQAADSVATTTPIEIKIAATTEASEDTQQVTALSNVATTVAQINKTTQSDFDTTTQNDIQTTTQSETETTITSDETEQKAAVSTAVTISNNTEIQYGPPKKDYVIFGILPNNTVVRKDPNDDVLETLTEASPYIVYGVLPNNTIIRKFPNGTRVPRVMQKIDVLPISPLSLRNPYSPIHNNPAIVRPQSNPIRVSTNVMTSTDTNNGTENRLTTDTVNNQQIMISSSTLNVKDSSMLGFVTTTNKPPAEKSTASHVLSLRTTTMLPSIDEILLNSISSAAKEEMVISSMTSSTSEPRILTLDIDPETKQIRTEKPGDENMNAVFKFIPIDEVTSVSEESNANVLKLATKSVPTTNIEMTEIPIVTETNTQISQIQINTGTELTNEPTTIAQINVATPVETNSEILSPVYISTEKVSLVLTTTESATFPPITNVPTSIKTITEQTTTATEPTTTTIVTEVPTTALLTTEATITTSVPSSTSVVSSTNIDEDIKKYQEDAQLIQTLLQLTGRSVKNGNVFTNNNFIPSQKPIMTTTVPTTERPKMKVVTNSDSKKLLQTLIQAAGQNIPNLGTQQGDITTISPTSSKTIEDDIKQFEEDTKLLKALLAATGQNPANFNIPTLDNIITTPKTTHMPNTTPKPTTSNPTSTTPSIEEDIKKFQEDAKLLQALLQATGQNSNNLNLPIISSVTSNVRMASKPLTTPVLSNPTTDMPNRPVFVSGITIESPVLTTVAPTTTFQPEETTTTENIRISTTYEPFTNQRRRVTTTTAPPEPTTGRSRSRTAVVPTARIAPIGFKPTTEVPTSSTFSVEEDVAFLKNLKSVLNTNNIEDPETALANRIIALAVEKSLNEITTTTKPNEVRGGKAIGAAIANRIQTTAQPTTTTTKPTTTTPKPTTTTLSTPSIEEDIKQFQEDTKLLQALIKATGQDPSKFNIPTITSAPTDVRLSPNKHSKPTNDDIKLLSNLLALPEIVTKPPIRMTTQTRPFGARIAVKDDVKNVQDDAKFLQTLITLQGIQETTTQRPKLTITGQTPDEALKLLQKTKSGTMVSEATHAPVSLSTEYGKSQDALLAALLKEQGFGPTTASSLDEQLRLAALLNQVVVTPKARRTTTPPPPPPPPRRPVLDGLAWLWQQWRETGPGPDGVRPSRRPSVAPSAASSTSNRVNWFGSGPFVGNADDQSTSNRIPLEPPAVVVASQQPPGQRPLVSAAINMTRAMSQFLGAAIQGAAQTVQNVIRAGQRAASDAYVNGSG